LWGRKMKDRFDLEQDIMQCWSVVDDIGLVVESVMENPKYADIPPECIDTLSNTLLGVKELYNLRFEKMWETFLQSHKLNEYAISGKSDTELHWSMLTDDE
jgi:hypothetical protein